MEASRRDESNEASLYNASHVEVSRATLLHEDEILFLTALDADIVPNLSNSEPNEDPADLEKKDKENRFSRAVAPGAFPSTRSTLMTAPDATLERSDVGLPSALHTENVKAMFRTRQGELTPATTEEPQEEEGIVPGAVSVVPNYAMRHDDDSNSDDNEVLDDDGTTETLRTTSVDQQHSHMVLTAQLADHMLDASERQRVFDEAVRTISDQVIKAEVLEDDSPKRRRRHRIVLFCLVVLITVLAVSLGLQYAKSSNIAAPPTMSPTRYVEGDGIFQTTEELYDAVDAYRAAGTTVEYSDVVLRYGPIGSWNVTALTNFSRVFDPTRTDTLSPLTIANEYDDATSGKLPTTNFDFAQFNADLSGWDVSNAETMMGMFTRCDYFTGVGLEKWNVRKVRDFSYMFMGAIVFNGTVAEWDMRSAEQMEGMFYGTFRFDRNLSSWDVYRVVDMSYMFCYADAFVGNGVSEWNVSNVYSMESMFHHAYLFNGDVEAWDTRSLASVSNMFNRAEVFDRDLSGWNVSKVTSMTSMFSSAYKFNGDVSTWDVSRVTDFGSMFFDCEKFNQDLSSWDTHQAELMYAMFSYATQFLGIGLEYWNTSNVSNMYGMFREAKAFNSNISGWDVHNVQDTANMIIAFTTWKHYKALYRSMRDTDEGEKDLADASFDISPVSGNSVDNATQVVDDAVSPAVTAELVDEAQLKNQERERIREEVMRNVSNKAVKADLVTDFEDSKKRSRTIFFIALLVLIVLAVVLGVVLGTQSSSSNPPDSPTMSPTLSYVNRDATFRTTEELYEAVDAYILSNNMNSTANTTNATPDVILRYGPIGSWDVSQITNFSRVFDPIRNDTLSWDIVASMYFLRPAFGYSTPTAYDRRRFNEDLSGWDVSKAETMMGMFTRADFFVGLELEHWNVGKVRDFSFMFMGASLFNGDISGWNTSSAENMNSMMLGTFAWDDNLSAWDVSGVTDMSDMFHSAESFVGDGLENWNVVKVTTMKDMFAGTPVFNGDVSTWNTSRVITTKEMFVGALSFNRNLSTWDMSQVTTTKDMFSFAYSFAGDVSTWNVSNNRDFGYMFSSCLSFNSNLSAWDVSNADQIVEMFNGATSFIGEGLSNWNLGKKVASLEYMFNGAASFNGNISSWDVSRIQYMDYMFAGSTSFTQDVSHWNVSSLIDATSMFLGAESFRQDLCAWENLVPPARWLVTCLPFPAVHFHRIPSLMELPPSSAPVVVRYQENSRIY